MERQTALSGIQDFGITFSGRVMGLFLSLGIQSALARFLGPEGRGSLAVCMVFTTLLTLIFAFGCNTASTYFVASRKFTPSEGLMYTCIYGVLSSALAVAVGFMLLRSPFAFVKKASLSSFYLALCIIPISLIAETFVQVLSSLRRFGAFTTFSTLFSFVRLLLTVGLLGLLSWGVNGALLAVLIAHAMTIIVVSLFFFKNYQLSWVAPSLHRMGEILDYGIRFYPASISSIATIQIGTIILAFFATPEQIGLFAVASTLTFYVMMIPDTLSTILLPRVANDNSGRRLLITRCLRLTAMFCGGILLLMAIFARPIVIFFFSSAFTPAVPLVWILAIAIFFRAVSKVFVPYLMGSNHPGILSISYLAGMLVSFLGLVLLLPIFGLTGAAVGMMAGYLTIFILTLVAFWRFSGLSLREIWQFRLSDWDFLREFARPLYGRISRKWAYDPER